MDAGPKYSTTFRIYNASKDFPYSNRTILEKQFMDKFTRVYGLVSFNSRGENYFAAIFRDIYGDEFLGIFNESLINPGPW